MSALLRHCSIVNRFCHSHRFSHRSRPKSAAQLAEEQAAAAAAKDLADAAAHRVAIRNQRAKDEAEELMMGGGHGTYMTHDAEVCDHSPSIVCDSFLILLPLSGTESGNIAKSIATIA